MIETSRETETAARQEALPEGALLVGVAGRPHGLLGALRLHPSSDRPERLCGLRSLWFVPPGTAASALPAAGSRFAVRSVRLQGRAALARLEGVDTREEAAAWTSHELWALPEELPAWGADEFGLQQVLGARLLDRDELVGTVADLISISGRDYFEVERAGRRVLVPAVKDWLIELDLAGGRIVMELPEGLVDD